jgi:glycosyltransferase involved in cell wall biosynthesis
MTAAKTRAQMPLKVLHVLPSIAPRHGGPTAAGLAMVRALRTAGSDARIVTTDDDVGERLAVPLHRWVDYGGVPVCFLPRVRARQHTLIGFTFAPAFAGWLKQHAVEFDFVHVHTVFSFPANVAMAIARRKKVPFAVRPLGQLCDWSLRQRAFWKRLQLALITRRNIEHAAFLHMTSTMEAEETSWLGFRCPVFVQPHGLDLPPVYPDARKRLRHELGVTEDRPLVVFMSRLHPKKGLEVLLEAAARERTGAFDLVIAGSGEDAYAAELHQLAARLGLASRVHWLGFVEDERKWRLLQGCDVFVLPSYSENFGIVVLEALACGLPVIVSDHVALAADVTGNGFGAVVPLETEALVAALREWLPARDRRADAGRRSVEFVRVKYSWDAVARRLANRYEEAVASRA